MATETVRIENMPDNSTGSPARVAYDLMRYVRQLEPKVSTRAEYLDLFKECLVAARGMR
jgi:hypothetical protein